MKMEPNGRTPPSTMITLGSINLQNTIECMLTTYYSQQQWLYIFRNKIKIDFHNNTRNLFLSGVGYILISLHVSDGQGNSQHK